MGGGERGKKKERKKKKKKKIGIRKTHPEEIMKKKFSYQVRPSLSPIFFFFFFFFSLSLSFSLFALPTSFLSSFFPHRPLQFSFPFFLSFCKVREKKKKKGVSEEEGGSFFFFFFFWYEKKKKHHTLYFKRREKNSKIFLVANSQGPNLSFFLRKRGWIREINDAQTGMLPGKRS